jgi:predicted PurR-regulated permease PerM
MSRIFNYSFNHKLIFRGAYSLMTAKETFRNTLVVLLTLAGAYILLQGIHILIVLLVAIVLASAVRPIVMRLTRRNIPEGISIVLVYLALALLIFTLMVIVLPPIVSQMASYVQDDSRLANRIILAEDWIQQQLQAVFKTPVTLVNPESIRTTITSFINGVQRALPALVNDLSATLGDAVLVFIMGVYWLTSYQRAVDFIIHLFRLRDRERVREVILEIDSMMGTYVRGVAFVAIFVGIINFLILSLLHVPNAVTWGFMVGVGTMLPIIGGFLSGGLATLLALIESPLYGLAVFATFVGVQQIENHYLTPRTMSRSINADPLLVIVAVFIGFTLYGVTGALLSVPVMGTIYLLVRRLIIEPRMASVSEYKTEAGAVLLETEPADTSSETSPSPTVVLPS